MATCFIVLILFAPCTILSSFETWHLVTVHNGCIYKSQARGIYMYGIYYSEARVHYLTFTVWKHLNAPCSIWYFSIDNGRMDRSLPKLFEGQIFTKWPTRTPVLTQQQSGLSAESVAILAPPTTSKRFWTCPHWHPPKQPLNGLLITFILGRDTEQYSKSCYKQDCWIIGCQLI